MNVDKPTGYCPCCGAPAYEDNKQEHDPSCIWYEEEESVEEEDGR